MTAHPLRAKLREAAEELVVIGAGNPRFEAELLMSRALARPRAFLFTHPEYLPTRAEEERFANLLERRLSSEPLQYVLGDTVFRDLTLEVRPGVLIPRAETEVLVEHAAAALDRWRSRREDPGERPWVIDVGVGSGAILLGLLDELRRSGREAAWFRPLAIDIAPAPLECTRRNATRLGLPRPALVLGDWLGAIDPAAPVAAIVSNPPYVSTAEMADLPPEIREHEPHEALHGGADGLAAIRILLDQAAPFLRRGTLLCLEIGATQAEPLRDELAARGYPASAAILPDLAGRPRIVLIELG